MRGIALLVVGLTACASDVDPPITAEADVELTARPAPPKDAQPDETPSKRSALDRWRLPGSSVALDSACSPPAATERAGEPLCNEGGKVAMESRQLALNDQAEPPCTMRLIESEKAHGAMMDRRMICVDGDHLVVSNHCVYCRTLDAGSAYHARLSAMGPAQHEWLHTILMLTKSDEKPTTADGWRRLAEKATPIEKR